MSISSNCSSIIDFTSNTNNNYFYIINFIIIKAKSDI